MEHVDEQLLAPMALGESVPGHDHVESCPQCRREVEELSAVVFAAHGSDAEVQPADELTTPPSSVWAASHAELGLDPVLETDPLQQRPKRSQSPNLHSVPTVQDEPTVLRPRRHRCLVWAVAGGVAVGLVIGGIGVGWLQPDTPGVPQPAVIAEIALDPLKGWTAHGNARVEAADDGAHEPVVDMPTEVDDVGYREVWLINPDVKRMVSLGVLTGAEGNFPIPDGLDLAGFPIVDFSLEQSDSSPAHSGDSIIRGILPT